MKTHVVTWLTYVILGVLVAHETHGRKLTDIEALDITWNTLEKMRKESSAGADPTAHFYESAFKTMEYVAQAHAASAGTSRKKLDLELLRKHLAYTLQKRNFVGLKERLGKTLVAFFDVHSAPDLKPVNKRPYGKRTKDFIKDRVEMLSEATKSFLGGLMDEIGNDIYDQIIIRDGDTTLIFVIDETGSMANEIRTAKTIATSIINEKRNGNVSYILSAFRDPDVKPAVCLGPEKREQFIREIMKLTPSGGGDCPELTFTGIINALNAGPQYGSQMIVFTDASAKDATAENIEIATNAARSLGITISFFTALNGCDKEKSNIEPFRVLAAQTNGQVFALKNDFEMLKLSGYVQNSLGGRTLLDATKENKTKPKYEKRTFSVDDTVEVLDISITTEGREADYVILKRPDGVIEKPTVKLAQSVHYKIPKPMPGEWQLVVSGKVGRHDMIVKGSGKKVIEFGYFFQFESGRAISPIEHPLLQYETIARVMLGGAEHVDIGSLYLQTVNKAGDVLQGPIALFPIGSVGVQFEAYLNVETNTTFQLQLKGKTKNGVPFTRIAPNFELPKPALLQVLYARKDFTVAKGASTFVVLELKNFGEKDIFSISIMTKDGRAILTRRKLTLRRNRSGFAGIQFKPKTTLETGQPAVIFVHAEGLRSRIVVKNTVRLLIVPKDMKTRRRRHR